MDRERLCFIHCRNAPSLGIGNATAWECPNPHDDLFRTESSPLLYGRPLRYLLVIVTAYSKNKTTSCFEMNVGCDSRGPTIHVVCGDLSFFIIVTLPFCCCVRCTSSCVRTLREGCRHDGPLSPYVHAVEPFVPLLFASSSSICVLVLRQGCVCGVRCMRGCCPRLVWCALCVCLPHLLSPLSLSISLNVQISSTPPNDHTHDDDDVPSAVRPVGACPVLLPVRVRGSVH
ncbi:trans-sialidase [Trypanosoma cruzi]|nr:trans-sialidase [Trypanosoma cruzi]